MMKIGLIAQSVHTRGGMERAAAEVMARVAQRHKVVIMARECDIMGENLKWCPIRTGSRPAVLQNWIFRQRVHHAQKRLGCDVTNSIGAAAVEADVITAQFCHAAFTENFGGLRGGHGGLQTRYQAWAQQVFTRQELRAYQSPRLKKVIAVSQGIKRELMTYYQVPEEKITVIPNAVDPAVFRPAISRTAKCALRRHLGLPETAFLCLFVGGDWERKGLRDAILAVSRTPKALLVVVGRGEIGRFQAFAAEVGACERVLFVGPSLRPQDYYAAADLFVFPSRYEAFSLVTLEAAASGLPILARRINGTEELIRHGVNGFFIGDTPEEMTARIQMLASAPDCLGEMSCAAIASSRGYTWDRVAAAQRQVFEEAIP